jgi:DNA-binding transcriptional MerR regulator
VNHPSRRATAAAGLTGRQLEAEINREVAAIRSQHRDQLPEHRCRVCQDPDSRARVNRLLSYGMKIAEIEDFVEDLNAKRPKNNQITYWSLRNHAERHFSVQDPTNAARRRILERRKAQVADEFSDAAAHLLSGMAYLDIVAQKGYEHLIAEDTVVDYETGLKAQLKLEEMQRDGAVEEQIAEMRRDVSILQQAVKDVVPANLMSELVARIDELKGNVRDEYVDAEVVDDDDEDDDVGYDPVLSADANDALGED